MIAPVNNSNAVAKMALSVEEAAAAVGASPATIRRAVWSGKLKGAKLGDSAKSRLVIRPADLDQWLIECSAPAKETEGAKD